MKELLIELYVTKMKNKYFLTLEQTRYLISIIYIGILFKVIIPKRDINYSNGEIINISGIEFDRKKVILNRDIYSVELGDTLFTNEPQKKTMANNWHAYIKNLQKLSFSDSIENKGEEDEQKMEIDI